MDQTKLFHSEAPFPRFVMILILLAYSSLSIAGDNNDFRKQFIKNYKTFQFKAQEELIRNKGGELIPDEIRRLLDEAMAEGKSFNQRMYLLDIANAMASGYHHIHGSGELQLKEVEALIKKELQQEEQRVAKLMRWKKEERFLGNFVMKEHMAEMEKEAMAPVIYPHWVHRIWFDCKVCHQEYFIMNRWRNRISHRKMEKGEQCGACHNGKTAFGIDKECERCHLAGKPEAERLHHAEKIDHGRIKEVAVRLGAEWNYDKLPNGKIPVDRFGFIDWLRLEEYGVFNPIHSLREGFKHEVRNNKILFVSKSKIEDVVFDHQVHSRWINCSSCHPEVFRETLTNDVKMLRMSKGKFCGYCHGKVSFTFADCKRCHNQQKDADLSGVLMHEGAGKK